MENKEIEKLYEQAKNESFASTHATNKYIFQGLISGMIAKLILRKEPEAKLQLSKLEQMERFLERLTLHNVMNVFQAKLIVRLEMQIALVEQEKRDLIQRSTSKITELSKELGNVKKRIKNDKESS